MPLNCHCIGGWKHYTSWAAAGAACTICPVMYFNINGQRLKANPKNHMSCCPICVYVVKNDSSFLNHIVVRHYWCNYACGKWVNFVVTLAQKLSMHVGVCAGIKPASPNRGVHGGTLTDSPLCRTCSKSGAANDSMPSTSSKGAGHLKDKGGDAKSSNPRATKRGITNRITTSLTTRRSAAKVHTRKRSPTTNFK